MRFNLADTVPRGGFICLAIILGLNFAVAQMTIKGGPTVATISFTEGDNYDYSMVGGLSVGIGYQFRFDSSIFSIQPEVNFVRKGSKETFDSHFTVRFRSETETKIDYLEIPLLLRVQLGKGNVQPFLNAGVSVSFGIGGRFSNKTMVQDPYPDGIPVYTDRRGKVVFGDSPQGSHDDKLYVDNSFDYGIQVGGGLLVFKRAILDVRYSLGLQDLYNRDDSLARVMWPGKHRVFMFSAGYQFRFKK